MLDLLIAFVTGIVGWTLVEYLLHRFVFHASSAKGLGAKEHCHRRIHTQPPRGRYGRWRRMNHFAHHFVDPRRAQGVTTSCWDSVFGTRLVVACVRVPRRLAMPWLFDTEGEMHAVYATDYQLVGSRIRDDATRRSDTQAAMANERPTV